jgi:restriction endonuclease Mrr
LQDQNVHSASEVKDSVAKKFNISDSERKKLSAKKSRPVFDTGIIQFLSQIRKEGLIVNESVGMFKITKLSLSESKKV